MAGGISEPRKIYTLGETFNKPVMPHCPSAAISSAASFHHCSTVTDAVRPHQYSYEFSGPREQAESPFEEAIVI